MTSCSIRWCGKCSKTSNFKKDGITFHRYPKDPNIKEKWINATRRDDWFPSPYSVICSRHFEEDCFTRMKNRRRLLCSAVPTLLLPILTNTVDFDLVVPSSSKEWNLKKCPSNTSLPSTPKRKTLTIETSRSYNTSIKKRLCRRVIEITDKLVKKNRQIKKLKQKSFYMQKKIATLKFITKDLERKKLINTENVDLLNKIGVTNKELVQRQLMKSNKKGCIVRKKFSPELRTFALTLNFYSTKAYQYVRKSFQTCLPSIKTISKWYQTGDGKPGFTKEAFMALKQRASLCKDTLICTLIFDEIKIKNKIEYVPSTQRTFGYIDFGGEIQTDYTDECTEALVFLVVGLNKRFKVPIGYFLTKGTKAEQKANLVTQAIQLCHESNVTIKSLTFDGCPANISMAKMLGCNLEPENLRTSFKHPTTNADIFVFLDPVHMLKLVRNAFEHYKIFEDNKGRKIKWEYLKHLQELQDREQFHLANKLRITHIQFKQNITKVKLAAQLFSRSVATALILCKEELKLPAFQDVAATAEMLLHINDLFDILDSKVHGHGFKRALNRDNAPIVLEKLEECKKFLLTVVTKKNQTTNVKLLNSLRSTGFLGFCIAIQSVKGMYTEFVLNQSSYIKYVPFHKISQDHLELLFASIRSHGGSNDNPTPRLFESIYKKILIHTQLIEVSTGNCVPLEKISILNCSSVQRINLTTTAEDKEEHQIINDNQDDFENGIASISLSQFAENAIEYIAGYVVSSLIKQLKCKTCIGALVTLNKDKNSFIAYRDMGSLTWPSQTVTKICRRCELIIKLYLGSFKKNQANKAEILVNKTLTSFVGEELFSDISYHQFHCEETNHVIDLANSVMLKYVCTRLAFITKSVDPKPTIRRIYTKLIHFKNN